MVKWINHVAIAAPRNGTTSHTVDPSSGTVAAGALFTPTAGNFLIVLCGGAVTSTTPSGWTLPTGGSAINNVGLYIWYRTAAGSDTFTTAHNASNYPVLFDIYEFAAGTAFIGSAAQGNVSASGGAGPSLSGLTATSNLRAGVVCQDIFGAVAPSYAWSSGTESIDTGVVASGTDGYGFSMTYLEDQTGATYSTAATSTVGSPTVERLVFAVNAASSGASYTPTPADPLGVTDSATSVVDAARAPGDPLGITDSAGRTLAADRAHPDGVGVTDSVVSVVSKERSQQDAVGITDSVAVVLAQDVPLNDSLGISDSATRDVVADRSATDAVGLVDNVTVALDIARSIGDQVGMSDSAGVDLTAPGSADLNDPLGVTDLLTTTAQILRTAADELGVTDGLTIELERSASPTDPIGLTDSVTVQAGATPSPADVIGVSDSAVAVLDRVITIADQVGTVDQVGVFNPAIPPLPTSGVSLSVDTGNRGLTLTAEARSLEVST